MATLLTCYYKPKPGGFCTRYFRAIEALLRAGHGVHYLAVSPFPIKHPACVFHRFPWPAPSSEGLLFWSIFHLLAPPILLYIALRYRVERVFCFGSTYALLLQPVRILKRIPLVLFLRGDPLASHRLNRQPAWLQKLELYLEGLGLNGTTLFVVSDDLRNRVLQRHRLLAPASHAVLRNNVDATAVLPHSGHVERPVHTACLGTLDHVKNQGYLIDVWRDIPPDSGQLLLFGTGVNEFELGRDIKRNGLSKGVSLTRWTSPEEIWPQIDLLVSASRYEGSPNAILEALGRDIPVIASDIPAHRELLPQEHLLPLQERERWVDMLREIMSDPVPRLGEIRKLQKVRTETLRFDWDASVVSCTIESRDTGS
jgi:glycosyltransferase involved in cell wall biosynthesis